MNTLLRVLRCVTILVCLGSSWSQAPDKSFGPVALVHNASGDLYVLDRDGRVFIVDGKGEIAVRSAIRIPRELQVMDMVAAELDGHDYAFVSARQGSQSIVQQFSIPDGKIVRSWSLLVRCAGLGLDSEFRRVYISCIQPNRVYRIDLTTNKIMLVEDIQDAGYGQSAVLGPVLVDEERQKLYVADMFNGVLYELDITRRFYRRILENLGQPSALAFNSDKRVIYIADGNGRILSFRPGVNQQRSIVSKQREFRTPTGVTVAADRTLWVADADAHALFQLSDEGSITRRWPK